MNIPNMANHRIIEVNGLSSILDEKLILSDVRFHVIQGEIAMILGSSGSGKTTILRHLLGLYPSSGNTVTVLGENPSQLDETEEKQFYQRLGVFYQNGALLNSYTVGENIALPLEQHTDLPDDLIEKIVKLKLHLVDLQGCYDMFPSQLSGGMLKRAALARAIIMDPPLLLCDEPGAGLDPVSLAKLDELILKLQHLLGITVLIITHNVSSILRLADRIIFLEQGMIIFEGSLSHALEASIPALQEFFNKGKGT
jgi:phospholipid/cholesterol/gamma-HCH transport system ATP-binding protein